MKNVDIIYRRGKHLLEDFGMGGSLMTKLVGAGMGTSYPGQLHLTESGEYI